MELVRDVLDKQVVDRKHVKMGKVDGLVIELHDGEAPHVAGLEIGAVALARRLAPRIGRWASRLGERLGGAQHREPYRIPWMKVRDVGIDVDVDLLVEETPVFDWQTWLRDHVIARIPGA
ncbi:hypothetical protein [Microvirga calopogonii]|uniref:hypothetical protein n=1 Tax=Microvirga calopogonii TaxID=2078013 RepID=UPI000E0D1BC9|nr:hypothetical protein [Microvirga calopogonii]